jgi:hypothetical protein
LRGAGEPRHLADLGDEHRRQHRTDPGQLLHRHEAGIGDQAAPAEPGEQVDLIVDVVDEPAQRLDPGGVGGGQHQPVQQLLTLQAEQIRHDHLDAALGQHRMHLALAVRAHRDQLCAVANQLPQLPGGRRRDPPLRESAHPQQVGQVVGVAEVVLHPAVLERLHPQRMRQMDLRTRAAQRVHRPVPPVGGLQHHLGRLAGPAHHRVQHVHVAGDAGRLENLTGLGLPHDHAAAAVQIDADELPAGIL